MLTRRGYIVDKENLTECDVKELTVTPEAFDPTILPKSFQVYREFEGTIALPRYWAKNRFGDANVFSGRIDSAPGLVFEGSLRSAFQEEIAEASINKLKNDGGGVLCLPTGTGKTVIALYAACALKVKTLIVVHKNFLMDQWAERMKQFVPLARVGRLQQGVVNVKRCDIVVGMLQSIAMREYDTKVFEGFGLVILDEVHVVPAPVFSRALFKMCAPCMLGMSATPERKDGLTHVINWFIGPLFSEHRLKDRTEVSVRVVPVHCSIGGFGPGIGALARIMTLLCNDAERNTLLAKVILDLAKSKEKVIVLSDRRAHCIELMGAVRSLGATCALYLGGMKDHELKESIRANKVLLATYSMAKEGLDIPELDALVLATPRSDVVQACGRILHGKSKNPVIVDVVDQWFIGRSQFNKRAAYYSNAGFTVIN